MQPRSAVRRRTLVAGLAFVALSTAFHFIMGPTLSAIAPMWRPADREGQTVTVFTISRLLRERTPPAPTPEPRSTILPNSMRHVLAAAQPLQHREIALVRQHAPAARVTTHFRQVSIDAPPRTRSDVRPPPIVPVSNRPTPVPQASEAPQPDTNGRIDHLAGAVVWGDDNPARALRLMPIGAAAAGRHVRVEVEVGVDGKPVSAHIVQSSGDAAVDQAALEAARASNYAPATLNGLPVHGNCVVEFSA